MSTRDVTIGGFIVLGYADDTLEKTIGFIAVAFGTINVVGGFLIAMYLPIFSIAGAIK